MHALAQAVESIGYSVTGTEGSASVTFENTHLSESQLDLYDQITVGLLERLLAHSVYSNTLGVAVLAILKHAGYAPTVVLHGGAAGCALAPQGNTVFWCATLTCGE